MCLFGLEFLKMCEKFHARIPKHFSNFSNFSIFFDFFRIFSDFFGIFQDFYDLLLASHSNSCYLTYFHRTLLAARRKSGGKPALLYIKMRMRRGCPDEAHSVAKKQICMVHIMALTVVSSLSQ